MAKRTFQIRANFPLQEIDLVETVSATSWPAALGAGARLFKRQIKGRRIKAASFTLQQVEVVESVSPDLAGTVGDAIPAETQIELVEPAVQPPAEQPQQATAGEPHNNS